MRAIYNRLSFQKIPARLVIEMAKTAVFWLNAFPVAGGVSQDLSPRTILTGQQVDYKRLCCYQFGEYTQTHEEHNSMNSRMVGAITLHLVGNGQGSFYFLSVTTRRVLNPLHTTALPMPDEVIDKLHRMARQQESNRGLVFAERNLNPGEYDDDDDNEMYHDNNNSDDEDDDDLSYNEEDDNNVDDDEEAALGPAPNNNVDDDGVDDDGSDNEGGDDAGPLIAENDDDDDEDQADTQPSAEVGQPPDVVTWEAAGAGDVNQDEEHDGPNFQGIPGVSEEEIESETPGVSAGEDNETSENGDDQLTLDEITDQVQPAQPGENNGKKGRYNLRRDQSRSYNHRYAGNDFIVDDESGIVMTAEGTGEVLETPQMSLKTGLRTFGTDGMKAVEKEI